ncbi:MAG TPA: OsmC family protein [Bacteroidia bacterium]|jgi:putative redox protein|nr:OsmC family protein [Bacteroidia bacterium]
MKISVKRTDDDFAMEAVNEDGNVLNMDSAVNIGGHATGFRPMQLLLAAVGGCSAIDVILILKKQKQNIEEFDVEVEGEREKIEDYSLFRNITLHFKIKGEVDPDKAERAVKLSIEKYCSVSKTLEPTAKINYKVTVN